MKRKCVVCGKRAAVKKYEKTTWTAAYGTKEECMEPYMHCEDCGSDIDCNNGKAHRKIRKRSQYNAVLNILAILKEKGISLFEVERILGMINEIKKQLKKGEVHSLVYTILVMICDDPTILENHDRHCRWMETDYIPPRSARVILPTKKKALEFVMSVYQECCLQIHKSYVNSPFTRWLERKMEKLE